MTSCTGCIANSNYYFETYHTQMKGLLNPLSEEGVVKELAYRVMLLILAPIAYPILGLFYLIGKMAQSTGQVNTAVTADHFNTLKNKAVEEITKYTESNPTKRLMSINCVVYVDHQDKKQWFKASFEYAKDITMFSNLWERRIVTLLKQVNDYSTFTAPLSGLDKIRVGVSLVTVKDQQVVAPGMRIEAQNDVKNLSVNWYDNSDVPELDFMK